MKGFMLVIVNMLYLLSWMVDMFFLWFLRLDFLCRNCEIVKILTSSMEIVRLLKL